MIYFLQDSTTCEIKIGFTAGKAEDRIKDLQTGNPSLLVLLTTMPGEQMMEDILHQQFAAASVRGEWFTPIPALILFIIEVSKSQASAPLAVPVAKAFDPTLIVATPAERKVFDRLIQLVLTHGDEAFSERNHELIRGWFCALLPRCPEGMTRVFDAVDAWLQAHFANDPDCPSDIAHDLFNRMSGHYCATKGRRSLHWSW